MATALTPPRTFQTRSGLLSNLPRHAALYLLFIGLLSLFQVALGANLIVLMAIDAVCLTALWPLTRQSFGPNDLLFVSLSFYYGTFSLFLKSLVLQPVQMNLKAPYLTSLYLVGGFGMFFLAYLFTERVMTRYYPGTDLRKWTIFEKIYASDAFLARFTLPFSALTLAFVIVVSIFSKSSREILLESQDASIFNALGAYIPLLQLAFAMQLTLTVRRPSPTTLGLAIATFTIATAASIVTNHKLVIFLLGITYAVHLVAYKIRLRPRVIILVLCGGALLFFYIVPLVQITRAINLKKSEIFGETFRILSEAHFNPAELQDLQAKLTSTGTIGLAEEFDYLAPDNLGTDRFTLLMPIDLIARNDSREPVGTAVYLRGAVKEVLPKAVVGPHDLQNISDEVAWRYSIREIIYIAKPALGLLGAGLGIAGPIGLLLYAPLAAFALFAMNKIFCNGSIWQNPWAIFIASLTFFDGETDFSIFTGIIHTFLPMFFVTYMLIIVHRNLK